MLARRGEIGLRGRVIKRHHRRRGDVRGHRNHAVTAVRHVTQQRRIVTRDEREARRDVDAQLAHAVHGAGGVLDADDVGQLGQACDGVVAHVDDGAARHVVQHHRNFDVVVQRLEMLVQTFLGRLVVVGRNDQDGVGADGLGVVRQLERLMGVVGPRAGDHLDAAGGLFDAELDDVAVLFHRQGRGLARRADRHQAVHARGDLIVDQLFKGLEIDAPVGERGHHRGDHPMKQGILRLAWHRLKLSSTRLCAGRRARHENWKNEP